MDKISVVTGGTRGLGFELVKRLVKDGKNVCVISRSSNKQFEKFYGEHQDKVKFYIADVADEKRIKKIAKEVCAQYEINLLINNAGVIRVGRFETNKKADVDAVFDSNVVGTMLTTAAFLPKMKKQNYGKIVVVISSAGLLGKPMESVYCAAKFAQRGYLLSLKEELKKTNIKVLGCYPGGINTNFYRDIRDYAPKEKTDKFMKPNKVADIICENIYASDSLNISEIIIERI